VRQEGSFIVSMDNIEHVFLLMLENRSFDTMLGWLYEHDTPALNIPACRAGRPVPRASVPQSRCVYQRGA
jgi:phospholipase C